MTSPTSERHHQRAAEHGPVPVAIVTVSDTRTPESDENAAFLREAIGAAGHIVAGYRLIPDDPDRVSETLDELAAGPARVILFNGGTGISPRDTTFDALDRKLRKRIPGFGELFRMLSFRQVGGAAMLSRATAGTYRGRVVISVPGSPAAVRLAWDELIASELQHLAWQVAG